MNFEEFKHYAGTYNLIPVYEKTPADLLTPVLAYLQIRKEEGNSFLLESVEGIGKIARYSFIGKNPETVFYNNGMELTVKENGTAKTINRNIFDYIREKTQKFKRPQLPELPEFTGGIIGYLGFENMSLIEDVIKFNGKNSFDSPDSYFGVYNTIAAFDHFLHQFIIISNVDITKFDSLKDAFSSGKSKILELKKELRRSRLFNLKYKFIKEYKLSEDKTDFKELVKKAKKNIYDGDVFQLVLSKRFAAEFEGDLINVYRALRMLNPSPYMFYLRCNDHSLIGSSPEVFVRCENGIAELRPIAGTRKRGRDEKEDLSLEKELLGDAKERAEHLMLVDLGRNDLGRVCEYGTVKTPEFMVIEKYSHVMHIVSDVVGKMKKDKDAFDLIRACFPAGTVSGAPKIRAMEIIDELEPVMRGPYAGCVGYFSYSGNLDTCITIRTIVKKGRNIYIQAGAGIVADSNPDSEYKECINKAKALNKAVDLAEAAGD